MAVNIQEERFFRELSKKYDLNQNIVKQICHSPFNFAKEKIADDLEFADILFYKLFRLKLKPMFKQDKAKSLSAALKEAVELGNEKRKLWKENPDEYKRLYDK